MYPVIASRSSRIVDSGVGGERGKGFDGGTSDGEKGVVGVDDDVLTEKGRA